MDKGSTTTAEEDDTDTGALNSRDPMDEYGLAGLDFNDDWDPVQNYNDSSDRHDRSACCFVIVPICLSMCCVIVCCFHLICHKQNAAKVFHSVQLVLQLLHQVSGMPQATACWCKPDHASQTRLH